MSATNELIHFVKTRRDQLRLTHKRLAERAGVVITFRRSFMVKGTTKNTKDSTTPTMSGKIVTYIYMNHLGYLSADHCDLCGLHSL